MKKHVGGVPKDQNLVTTPSSENLTLEAAYISIVMVNQPEPVIFLSIVEAHCGR